MTRLAKQIKLLDQEITRQKAQLSKDYAALKQNVGTSPGLLKGFLWGFSLGYLILAPKLKHKPSVEKSAPDVRPKKKANADKENSLHKLLLASLPGLLKLL